MQGKTPHEIALAAAAAGADPDAARYADVHRILHVSEITPGIPFPHIDHDRAVFFYVGITDPDEAAREIRTAEQVLAYTFGVSFRPRQTVAHDVRHDILTAVLPIFTAGCFIWIALRQPHSTWNLGIAILFTALAALQLWPLRRKLSQP